MKAEYDSIVIGGGIIGAAIAYEQAKSGRRVLVVEKNSAIGSGSTSNSCAIIRTHYSTMDGAALALANYQYWEDWPGYLAAPESETLARYREVGCLYSCYESNGYGAKLEDIANAIGIPYEVWTPRKMRAKLPIIDAGEYFPAKRADAPEFGSAEREMRFMLFFPKAGFVSDPQLATQNIASAAERNGADIALNSRVVEIRSSGGRVSGVRLNTGETVKAPVVVNASGPHSYKVNGLAGVEAGMNIKTRALRVEVAHVPSPPGFDFENCGYIGSDADIGGYWRPEVGNNILVGSEEPECDELEWVDPDQYNTELTDQARQQVLRAAQRFPSMGIPNSIRGIVDLYDVADDWIPIYDCSDLKGFYMAVGTSGNQFKNAPVVGMMMNGLIEYCESGRDHDREPFRYPLPNLDYTLDMSYCSRKREINPESSFSVVG